MCQQISPARTCYCHPAPLLALLQQTDLVTVQMLPEWPAANILLRRFIKQLASEAGLKHKDAAVKLACGEFTGQLATSLCLEALSADREADEVQAVKEAAQAAAGEMQRTLGGVEGDVGGACSSWVLVGPS